MAHPPSTKFLEVDGGPFVVVGKTGGFSMTHPFHLHPRRWWRILPQPRSQGCVLLPLQGCGAQWCHAEIAWGGVQPWMLIVMYSGGAPGHHDNGIHVLLCIALLGVTVGFQKRFFKMLLECFL